MRTENNNNNSNLLMYNLLSDSIKKCLWMYRNGKVSKAMLQQTFWLKIAQLDAVLKSVSNSYQVTNVDEQKSVYFYHGFKFFVVHSYQQARKLIAAHLYKGVEVEERYAECMRLNGNCDKNCLRCPLYARYGRPRIWVYVFGEKEPVCLCDYRVNCINQETVDTWYKLSEVSQEFFEELARQERSAQMNAILRTETPWLGYETLKDLYRECGSWERFMDIIDATTESINSEGVWDVELTTSMVSREGSCLFETTKAENGSTALSPKRMVYVENPKSRIRYEVLPIDRINLFLSLTFYKYAGFQPMRPVVEVSLGNGYTDYVINDGNIGDDEGRETSLLVTDEGTSENFEFKINFFNNDGGCCTTFNEKVNTDNCNKVQSAVLKQKFYKSFDLGSRGDSAPQDDAETKLVAEAAAIHAFELAAKTVDETPCGSDEYEAAEYEFCVCMDVLEELGIDVDYILARLHGKATEYQACYYAVEEYLDAYNAYSDYYGDDVAYSRALETKMYETYAALDVAIKKLDDAGLTHKFDRYL